MEFFHVSISEQARNNVLDVLDSGYVNEGEYVRRFEKELSTWCGKQVLCVSSCTAAMHLALLAAGIKPDDEIILPSQTFVATASVILQCGAKPVFADINPKTGNIDPKSILENITKRTVAIMPVHFGGLPCDMDEINKIAKEYNLTVIEDAAHGIGVTYHGKLVGCLSDYTCFSFQSIKTVCCGDGGCLTFPEDKLDDIRIRKWFGIDKQNVVLGYNERLPSMDRLGFKYNMNNISAALGLGNLTTLPRRLKRRRDIASIYRSAWSNIEGLELMELPEDVEPSYWVFPILVNNKYKFFENLQEAHIPTKMINWGIDREPIFLEMCDNILPGQRYFDDHHLCIPLHEGLTDSEVEYIVDNVKKSVQ